MVLVVVEVVVNNDTDVVVVVGVEDFDGWSLEKMKNIIL